MPPAGRILFNAVQALRTLGEAPRVGFTEPVAIYDMRTSEPKGAGRGSRSEAQPPPREGSSVQTVPPAADASMAERCAIVYERTARCGEFQVVVTEAAGSGRCVARSPAFRVPRFGGLRRQGAARTAHELLVSHLEACGWSSVDPGGPWHKLGFVRPRAEGRRSRRSLVTVVREAGQARFVAEELDTYGKPKPLALSPSFGARRGLPLWSSQDAKASLDDLVGRMESMGWKAAEAVGRSRWYEISLWRPCKHEPNGRPLR
jgi:hypothetical protein